MLRPEREKESKMMKELRANMLPIIQPCLLQTKVVTINKKEETLEQGPCNKINDGKCISYFDPSAKWKNGDCALASHLIQVEDVKRFVNPIKASKRG